MVSHFSSRSLRRSNGIHGTAAMPFVLCNSARSGRPLKRDAGVDVPVNVPYPQTPECASIVMEVSRHVQQASSFQKIERVRFAQVEAVDRHTSRRASNRRNRQHDGEDARTSWHKATLSGLPRM